MSGQVEADVVGMEIIFRAAALIEPGFDRRLGNFFGKREQVMFASWHCA